MNDTNYLKLQIKKMIVNTLNLNDVNPEDIDDDKNLFSGENIITLDSVDGLELIMVIQRDYGVKLDDQNVARDIVNSVNNIVNFIISQKAS